MAAVSVMMLPSASLRVGTAQRINLPQTLARRTGLVKALHVNHLVGNIGREHQLANRRAPSRHAINGYHGRPPVKPKCRQKFAAHPPGTPCHWG